MSQHEYPTTLRDMMCRFLNWIWTHVEINALPRTGTLLGDLYFPRMKVYKPYHEIFSHSSRPSHSSTTTFLQTHPTSFFPTNPKHDNVSFHIHRSLPRHIVLRVRRAYPGHCRTSEKGQASLRTRQHLPHHWLAGIEMLRWLLHSCDPNLLDLVEGIFARRMAAILDDSYLVSA